MVGTNETIPKFNNVVTIAETGLIRATGEGMFIRAFDTVITNAGFIEGNGSAIAVNTSIPSDGLDLSAFRNTITNYGTINGGYSGVAVSGESRLFVENHGTINGRDYAIISDSSQVRLENTGMINGQVEFSLGNDHITNHGGIDGTILTKDGNDVIRNTGYIALSIDMSTGDDAIYNEGTLADGAFLGDGDDVYYGGNGRGFNDIGGGAGNDYFNVGMGIDLIDGGAGIDVIDFYDAGPVTLDLQNVVANTGVAAGDTVRNVEHLYGSISGSDFLRGNFANNVLLGQAGDDTLRGGAGADTIVGGTGVDELWGSIGADLFVFEERIEYGDRIMDFNHNRGDRIEIDASDAGGGLVAGNLAATAYAVSVRGLATDADDRLILRTSDKTVWFDRDGTGAAEAILLVDLQQSAQINAASFILV